ncbi:MAG: chemotaxis response regulator protein-glutamate methylesterase [Bacillota bacterium]
MINKEQKKPLKVMVVDDSAFMRRFISDIINSDADLELVGTARDGLDALRKRQQYDPDVITLDVEMPNLNGLETLKRLMQEKPLPVVMVSSLTREGNEITIEALSCGAVDFVTKPAIFKGESTAAIREALTLKIKAAAAARLFQLPAAPLEPVQPAAFTPLPLQKSPTGRFPRNVVAIGASTGGPRALDVIFRSFPPGLPAAFLVTQHMPAGFTESLSRRLNLISELQVREARGGEGISEGEAYLAPGGYHLVVKKNGVTELSSAPPIQHVRPSADVMMDSLAETFGNLVIGVILTGMGRDGADGMSRIKEKGGRTICQDPSTAVISSMPQAVINDGMADLVVPLEQVGSTIVRLLRGYTLKERI